MTEEVRECKKYETTGVLKTDTVKMVDLPKRTKNTGVIEGKWKL